MANSGTYQTFTGLKASTTYSVSARCKVTTGIGALWTTGGATNNTVTTTSGTWVTVSTTFATDATPTNVLVYIGGDEGSVTEWGQIAVNEGTTAMTFVPNPVDDALGLFVEPITNLVKNGSFKGEQYTFWTKINGDENIATATTGIANNFDTDYILVDVNSANGGLQQTLTNLKISTKYSISVLARTINPTQALKVWTTGATTNLSIESYSGTWVKLNGFFITDASGGNVVLKIGSAAASTEMDFDSIIVTEGEVAREFYPHPDDFVQAQLDNTAGGTDAETTKAPTSNVMYDHAIKDATAAARGHATAAQITKLDGIEALADVTDAGNIASAIGGTAETTPLDADEFPFWKAVGTTLKKVLWSTIKSTLKTYNDTLYVPISNANIIKTSGLLYFNNGSFANVDTTNYKWVLPAAGTYICYGNFRIIHNGGGEVFGRIKLYNNTASADVTSSDRLAAGIISAQNTNKAYIWMVTVTGASTIYLRGIANSANQVGIECDGNGYNEVGYFRIA